MTYIGFLGEGRLYLVSIKQDFYIRFEWANKSKTAFQHSKQDFNWDYHVGILKTFTWTWKWSSQDIFLGFKAFKIIFPPNTKEYTNSDKLIRNITEGKSVWQDFYYLLNFLLDRNNILQDTVRSFSGVWFKDKFLDYCWQLVNKWLFYTVILQSFFYYC